MNFAVYPAESLVEKDKQVARLVEFVDSKTGGERFLKRADINPAELKDILPDICFFSPVYNDDGEVVDVFINLMGTRAVGFYGEYTNKNVSEHQFPEVAERVTGAIKFVVQNRYPFQAEAEALSSDETYLLVKALYFPMAEDGETIDRILVYVRVSRPDDEIEA